MKFGQLEIPDAIITAQEAGTLVLFVGAGASMAPPSNLPSFEKLALQVQGDKQIEGRKSPEDILNICYLDGIPIHSKVKSLIKFEMGKEGAEPSKLHWQIPQLFKNTKTNPVRIVTTNFDTYLSETKPSSVKEYHAPDLPQKNDFSGLVYLHGSIADCDPQNLVLTKEDFSKAYMTNAWATRFFKNMYRQYTVVFVGYSHEDVLVTYLALGSELQNYSVFAFTDGDEKDLKRWADLKIKSISYPNGKHEVLLEGITRWADEIQSTFSERLKKFIGLISVGIPATQSEEEFFIKKYLLAPGFIKEFIAYALTIEWAYWIIENGFSDFIHNEVMDSSVFTPIRPWIERDEFRLLGSWLVDHFIVDLQLLETAMKRHQGGLSWPLALELMRAMKRCKSIDREVFRQIALLVIHHCEKIKVRSQHLFLLQHSLELKEYSVALVILRELIRPRTGMDLYDRESGSDSPLSWNRVEYNFTPNMLFDLCVKGNSEFREKHTRNIADICLVSLISSIELVQALSTVETNSWVQVRFVKRSSNSGWSYREIIANLAVECFEYLVKRRGISALDYSNSCAESESSIIRRIGIYLVNIDDEIAPKSKISWLVAADLIFTYPEYHEAFCLVRNAISACDETDRIAILESVRKIYKEKKAEDSFSESEISDYCFHLGAWLKDQITDSQSVREFSKWCSKEFMHLIARETFELPVDDPSIPFEESICLASKTDEEILHLIETSTDKKKSDIVHDFYSELKNTPNRALGMLQVLNDSEKEPDINLVAWVLGFIVFKEGFVGEQYESFVKLVSSEVFANPFQISLVLAVYQRTYNKKVSLEVLQCEYKIAKAFWVAATTGKYVNSISEMFKIETALCFLPSILSRILSESNSINLNRNAKVLIENIAEINEKVFFSVFEGIGKSFFELFKGDSVWASEKLSGVFSPSIVGAERAEKAWFGFFRIVNERREEMSLLRSHLIESFALGLINDRNFNCSQMVFRYSLAKYDDELINAYIAAMDDKSLSSFIMHLRFDNHIQNDFDGFWKKWLKKYLFKRLESYQKPIQKREYTEILLLSIENMQIYPDLESLLDDYTGGVRPDAGSLVKASLGSGFHNKYPVKAAMYLSQMVKIESIRNSRNKEKILEFAELLLEINEQTKPILLPVLEILAQCGIRVGESHFLEENYSEINKGEWK